MLNVRLAGGHLYGKQLFTWLSLVVSLLTSFVLSFSPLDVLDEIWDVIESVSEGFLTYSRRGAERDVGGRGKFAQHGICLEGQLVVERLRTGHRICENEHFSMFDCF